jgi:hypothetical protein
MSASNPTILVYNALWALLESESAFTDLVLPKNRLKRIISADSSPKRSAQAADLPAVLIEPSDGLGVADFTNSDSHVKKTFQVKIATGSLGIDVVSELEWVVLATLSTWEEVYGEASASALTWRGRKFVKHLAVYEHDATLKEQEVTRSETGWATTWAGEVWMLFPRSDIVPGPG